MQLVYRDCFLKYFCSGESQITLIYWALKKSNSVTVTWSKRSSQECASTCYIIPIFIIFSSSNLVIINS